VFTAEPPGDRAGGLYGMASARCHHRRSSSPDRHWRIVAKVISSKPLTAFVRLHNAPANFAMAAEIG
jgi:hypothetical protein